MVVVNVRYVVERTNKDGTVRRYWVRAGYDTVRLPAEGWAAEAERLNGEADAGRLARRKARLKVRDDIGTVADWCRRYEATTANSVGVSRPFSSLAANTQKNYLAQLRRIQATLGHIPLLGITRRVLVEYLENIPTQPLRRISRNVWLNLFALAWAQGEVSSNPAAGLRIGEGKKRTALWMPEDVQAWLDCGSACKFDPLRRGIGVQF